MRVHLPGRVLANGRYMPPGIGDVVFMEPALRHLSHVRGVPVELSIAGNDAIAPLFDAHPHILPSPAGFAPGPNDHGWTLFSEDRIVHAYKRARENGLHCIDAYYELFGLDHRDFPEAERVPRLYGDIVASQPCEGDYVAIAPFSASCGSVIYGWSTPNKLLPLAWWAELARRSPLPIVCLGHAGAPEVPGTIPVYGRPLREVAAILRGSRGLVCVATGVSVIAGMVGCPIAMLLASEPAWMVAPRGSAKMLVVVSGTPPAWEIQHAAQVLKDLADTVPPAYSNESVDAFLAGVLDARNRP